MKNVQKNLTSFMDGLLATWFTYTLEVLRGQKIKLIHAVSESEFQE